MSAPTEIVFYCNIHHAIGSTYACHAQIHPLFDEDEDGACNMVEYRLVDPSALVLLRDKEGNWPEWAVAHMSMAFEGDEDEIVELCESVLDALAAASKEGKT